MRLSERIAKLENGAAKGLTEIIVKGGLEDWTHDDTASAGGLNWSRGLSETVEAFKARVRREVPAGEKFLIWGGLPE
jgi:hypothetical protein